MRFACFVAACVAGFLHTAALAQRPVPLTLVNPYPVTGAADIAGTSTMSRVLRAMQSFATPSATDALLQHLQRSLVAELAAEVTVTRNPRAGGTTAAEAVGTSTGRVLLFGGSGLTAGTTLPALRQLQPVALVARIPLVLVTRSDDSANGLAQWLEPSSGHAQPLTVGIPGERTAGEWLLRQLQTQRKARMAAVTFNGGNGALRGLLAGQVTAAVVPLPAVLPYAAGQRLRILAIAAADRHRLLPAVPSFAQAGWPAVNAAGWHGLFASRSLSASEVMRVRMALAAALRAADAREALEGLGYVAEFGDAGVLEREVLGELGRNGATAAADVQRSDSSGGLTVRNIFSRVRS